MEEIFDKTSDCIAWLVNKTWLSRYPRCHYIIYENGSEFKLNFEYLCVTQPSYREVGVHFKRVGDIKVVKCSVKSYVTILSGQCAVVGGMFATALS